MKDPSSSDWAGRRLGVYELQERIGKGGMGEVYRARDTRLGRHVAVKILPRSFTDDPDRRARLDGEARILAALNHPNIATIHGIEDSDGLRALVMELVDGPTLADRIAQGPIPLDEACSLASQIAKGLEAAHERSIIHRDLKPANIKVRSDGTVKVLDFGLAKLIETTRGSDHARTVADSEEPTIAIPARTQAGVILGTPAYMSPEHASGYPIDKRTDIWAFGCVLYEMLTGVPTFGGDTISHTLARIFAGQPDWAKLPDATPEPVRELLSRCLVRDSHQRLRDIGEARIILENSAFALRDKARHTNPDAVSFKPRATHASWSPLALIAFLVLIAGLFTIGVVLRSRSSQSVQTGPSRADASQSIQSSPLRTDASIQSRDALIEILEARAQRILNEMDRVGSVMIPSGGTAPVAGNSTGTPGGTAPVPRSQEVRLVELNRRDSEDRRDLERIRTIFEQLHRKHIEALRRQEWVLAHEIEVEIYHLMYLYEPFRRLVLPISPLGQAISRPRVPFLATVVAKEGTSLSPQMDSYPASASRERPLGLSSCVFDKLKAMVRTRVPSSTAANEPACKPDLAPNTIESRTSTAAPPWSEYRTWLQLSKGMAGEAVKRILGEPEYVTAFGGEEVWYYGAGKYRVFLTDGRFDRWSD